MQIGQYVKHIQGFAVGKVVDVCSLTLKIEIVETTMSKLALKGSVQWWPTEDWYEIQRVLL